MSMKNKEKQAINDLLLSWGMENDKATKMTNDLHKVNKDLRKHGCDQDIPKFLDLFRKLYSQWLKIDDPK